MQDVLYVALFSLFVMSCSGIGIVNAIEVVNAFPEEDGLHKFREWIESPDPTILGKFDRSSQAGEVKKSTDSTEEIKQIFMEKHVILYLHHRISILHFKLYLTRNNHL